MKVWATLFAEWLVAGIAEAVGGKIVERLDRWLSRPKKKKRRARKEPDPKPID